MTSNYNRFITANECVRRVLGPMGLPVPTNVFDSNDNTSKQMIALLTECGQELLSEYDWQALTKTHTIVTTTDVDYPIPSDLERYIDETGWNNTGRVPLIGPTSPQQWRMLQARRLGGTTLRLQYIIRGNNLTLYYAPTPSQTLQLDYITRGWVQDATDSTVYRDYPANANDVLMYHPLLITSILKYKWRDAKGFDSTSALAEYEKHLNAARYADRPHTSLPVSGRRSYPYLGQNNMTDTGYGLG